MSDGNLIARMEQLRRTLRIRLFAFGTAAVLGGGIIAFLVIAFLDYLLWLPPFPRLITTLVYCTGGIVSAWHWIGRPMAARLTLPQLAAQLERYRWPLADSRDGRLEDRLSSTVGFLLGDQAGSEPLRRKVVENTDRIVRDVRFQSALSLRPMMIQCSSLLLALMAAGWVAWTAPGFLGIGLQRYFAPFSQVRWPRDVEILPLSQDMRVPYGESAALSMRVVRGLTPTMRAVVHLRDDEGETTTFAMRRDPGGEFTCSVPKITEHLVCWFEAGDDSTVDHPFEMHVVRRPTVLSALATIHPPDYAERASSVVLDLAAGALSAVRGSRVHVTLRSSKPLGGDYDAPTATLELTDGRSVRLSYVSASDDSTDDSIEGEFLLEDTVEAQPNLIDIDGLANLPDQSYRLRATADESPTVAVIEPQASTDVTPSGAVDLLVRVEDDFGIARLDLQATQEDGNTFSLALSDYLTPIEEHDRAVSLAQTVWELKPHALKVGESLTYHIEARDRCTTGDPAGQLGRSAEMRLHVISADEYEDRVRSELALLQDRLQRVSLDQQALIDKAQGLLDIAPVDEPLQATDAETASDAAERQLRLANRLHILAKRFDQIQKGLSRNGGDPENSERVREFSKSLAEAAGGAMQEAARRIDQSRREPANPALDQALHAQADALHRVRQVLRSMDQWGDLQEIVGKTRNLFDRQQTLRDQTLDLGKRTLGQRAEDLEEPERTDLRQTERAQSQLADELEGLLNRVAELAEHLQTQDEVAADALKDSLRSAAAGEAARLMREAAKSISENRTTAASVDQQGAESALADMLAALQEGQRRELLELAKRVENHERAVAHLLARQRELLAVNQEAQTTGGDDAAYARLAEQQRMLHRNASSLAEEIKADPRLAGPALHVRRGAGAMERAETELNKPAPPDAEVAQKQAVDALLAAVDELSQLAAKARQEAMQRTFAAVKTKLESIRGKQVDVNAQTAALADPKRDPMSKRLLNRRISRLAAAQKELITETEAAREDIADAEVFLWVIERVIKLMETSWNGLKNRTLDPALAEVQEDIVSELALLIEALDDAAELPAPDEYAESGSGGGEGASGDQAPPIPSVAELLVLKSLQIDLNTRTKDLNKRLADQPVTEAMLTKMKSLSERQQTIRTLAEQVTRRAQEGK